MDLNRGIPNDQTQFPIVVERYTKNGNRRKVMVRAESGGISAGALALVKALQPYNRGQDAHLHPLAVLKDLSNSDKHRTLVSVAIDLGRVKISIPKSQITGQATRLNVEDGTLVFWILEDNPSYDPEMQMEAEPAPAITFLDAPGVGSKPSIPAVEVLTELLDFTQESVVQRFSALFFGKRLSI